MLGVEAVGVIEKLGKKISDGFKVGDRVGYYTGPSVLFKDMTAHYLVNQSYKVTPGAFVIVHGANSGLGQIICQWAKNKKDVVLGSVSSDKKMKIALQGGCTYAINYNDKDFISKVMEITQTEE